VCSNADLLRFSEAFDDAEKLLAAALELGLDDIVSKKCDQPYRSAGTSAGSRSRRRLGARRTDIGGRCFSVFIKLTRRQAKREASHVAADDYRPPKSGAFSFVLSQSDHMLIVSVSRRKVWGNSMRMEQIELAGGAVKVKLTGPLDLTGAGEIDMPLSIISGKYNKVIVDLTNVVVFNPNDDARKVLRSTGVDEVIGVVADEAAAIAA
jgi:hypothetical protein